MKDIKYSLKAITIRKKSTHPLWKAWRKELWRDYLYCAIASTAFAVMTLLVGRKVIVPMFGAATSSGAFPSTCSVAEYVVMFSILLLVLYFTIFCSLRAHKAMRRVVLDYGKKDMSTERRNLLLVENTMLTIAAFLVAFLPAFVLFVSTLAAESSMVACVADTPIPNVLTMPSWVTTSFCMTTFIGILFVECVLTFVRFTFRTFFKKNETKE